MAFGYDFVGYDFDEWNDPSPDTDPLDNCAVDSHGTFTAGIIAADASNISSGLELLRVSPSERIVFFRAVVIPLGTLLWQLHIWRQQMGRMC